MQPDPHTPEDTPHDEAQPLIVEETGGFIFGGDPDPNDGLDWDGLPAESKEIS